MNGIERITQRIDADTQAEIDRVLGDAKARAAQISSGYQEQAAKEAAEQNSRNEKEAAEREKRLVSSAQMESRKVLLTARQEMVELAFQKALEKLCALPDEKYAEAAAQLLCQAAPDGRGEAVFSETDRARIGQSAVDMANEKLGGGKLTLSENTRKIRGGFVLVNGNVEVNCTFETLIRLQKGEISGEVAKHLFPNA